MKMKFFTNIIIAILCLGACVFAFVYIFQEIQSKNEAATQAIEEFKTESERVNKIAALNEEIKTIKDQTDKLNSHFARSSDIVPFLDNLQSLGVLAGAPLEVSSVSLSTEGDSLDVAVRAEGSFASVHKLLALLQNSQYQLQFSAVKFSTSAFVSADKKVKNTNPTWEAVFTIKLTSFNT